MRFFARFCIAALLVLCLLPMAHAKRVPNLGFQDLTGKTTNLSDLRGSITVINFWATWCGPCQEELPLLSKLEQQYESRKVRFVAVSADENADSSKTRAKIDAFAKAHNVSMEVWAGASLDTLDRLSLGNELPATIIVDEQGEVIARILGEAREPDITNALDWLLNGRQGPAPTAVTKHY